MLAVATTLLLAAALTLAGATDHSSFRYELVRSIRRTGDSCRMCFGDDCAPITDLRCQYYAVADDAIDRDDEAGDISPVDQLVSDMTQQALMSWSVDKCVPFISYYTNCNKENICVGCKTCTCSEAGVWSCSQHQHCQPVDPVKMDHHTLLSVIQSLNELTVDNSIRRKRLANKVSDKLEVKEIGLMDIAEWMYKSNPINDPELPQRYVKLNITGNNTDNTESSTKLSTSSYTTEIETLGFDEVLKNIAFENHKRRKSQLGDYNDTANFYMGLEKHMDNKNCTDQFLNVLNDIEEGIDVTEPTDATSFVVDLIPRGNKATDSAETNKEILNIIYKEENGTIDKINDEVESNLINRKKRDSSTVMDQHNATQDVSFTTTASIETTTNKQNSLRKNVLLPLTNIIYDKQNEVKDLLQIKENLLHIMEIHYNDTELNTTKVPDKTNTYFSVFKLDLFPEIHEDLRRNNLNILEKLLYKLKRDIYEVLRDIARVQKLSSTRGLPDDLKMLIRSMKYYVHKQGSIRNFKKKDIQLGPIYNDTRRSQASDESLTPKSIKRQLVDILETLDKELSHSENAWINLSKYPRKILRRVVKQNFVDEYSVVGFRFSDNDYNMTTDLRTIGKDWPYLMEYVTNSPSHEKIYAMKLLHFTLSSDVIKMTNAISLIDFAHSRRMSPIKIPLAEELLKNINAGLISIKNKVKQLFQYQTAQKKDTLEQNVNFRMPSKKQSFLKRLKNMLKKSRKEILNMGKKPTPKSDVSKYIAKKKHDALSNMKMAKDKETMLKWQAQFNIQRRKKRDLSGYVSNIKNRMKNIIPKYLRGKVNPAIQKHKKKPKSVAKKTDKKKNHHLSTVRTIKKAKPQISRKKNNKTT